MEWQEIPKEGSAVASLEWKEQGPKELEAGAKCQEVLTEKDAVKSSKLTRKRPRGRYIAAGRRVKPTKLTRGECESRRKLFATCRKVFRHAAVEWCRKNFFRDIRTERNCGPREEVTMTLRAGLTRRKGTFVRIFGPRKMVDHGRNWPPPAGGWLAVQEYCIKKDMDYRKRDETRWHQEPRRKQHGPQMALERGNQGSIYFWEAEECTGRSYIRLLVWRSRSKMPDLLPGGGASRSGHCGGKDPLRKG
jgi:hypothetical protein